MSAGNTIALFKREYQQDMNSPAVFLKWTIHIPVNASIRYLTLILNNVMIVLVHLERGNVVSSPTRHGYNVAAVVKNSLTKPIDILIVC